MTTAAFGVQVADGAQQAGLHDASAESRVALGRIADAYGLAGWVKILPFGASEDSVLLSARDWQLVRHGPAPLDRRITVERAREHAGAIVAKPLGCDDRDAALALKGAEVRVRRSDFPAPADGEYYWVDLIGCEVTNPDGVALGRVVSVDDHGAHAILQLDTGTLIPFVSVYILSVDTGQRAIVADWQADY